jgi:hypothetical protein
MIKKALKQKMKTSGQDQPMLTLLQNTLHERECLPASEHITKKTAFSQGKSNSRLNVYRIRHCYPRPTHPKRLHMFITLQASCIDIKAEAL